MASSSSNTSSTSSSSSTTSTPSAARVLPTRAAAPEANAALGVAPAGASAPASAPGVAPAAVSTASALNVATASTTAHDVSHILPPRAPRYDTSWGGTKNVPAPTNFLDRGRRGGRHQNSAGVSRARNSGAGFQNASRTSTEESGWARWQNAADPTTTSTPVMWSTDVGSSSHRPWQWSKPLPYVSTRDPTPTDASPAFATSSSTTPSSDITMVPDASGSAPAVVTVSSAHTARKLDAPGEETIVDAAPEQDAPASTLSSAPGAETIVDAAREPDVTTYTTPSAPVLAKIVDAALEQDASAASIPSSASGVTTIADASAKTSASGAAPTASAATSAPGAAPTTIPSLRNHWLAKHWGIVPRPVQQAVGGNGGMPPVEALVRPDLLCPWREQVPSPLFGDPPCWVCCLRAARLVARPCGHLTICVRCYSFCYANSNRFLCPCCSSRITWQLCC